MKLWGKSAVVTGSSRGIGRAIALELAREGADVVVNYQKSDEQAKEVVERIKSLGRKSVLVKADLSDVISAERIINETIKEFGKIDILVNNAGVLHKAPMEDLTVEDWDRVMNINLRGAFLCSQHAGKQMIKQREGNIINISSIAALNPEINMGAYSVSKAGLIMLSQLLAVEWAKYNIRVNAVCPGPVETPMIKEAFETPDLLAARVEGVPLRRFGRPEEVAKLVAFLASDDSSNITGEYIVIDGGSARSMYYLVEKLGGRDKKK